MMKLRFSRMIVWTGPGILMLALTLSTNGQDTNFNFKAIQISAAAGDSQAQFKIAQCYAKGQWVEQDDHRASQYLQKAAEQGNVDAQIALGAFYGKGRGVPRSLAMAIYWYQKAAEEGNPLAEYAMGNFYSFGRGVTNDMDEAIKWWSKAADQNQPDAQAALGDLYLIPGVPYGTNYLNYPEAMRLLRLAAARGSVSAMNNLGVAYETGLAVKLDFKEAAKWYRMAADQGDARAQGNLGQLYFDGRGVPFDLEQAYKWFKLGSLQGQILGVKGLANFTSYKLLTPKQLAEAEQMVGDYRPILTKSDP